MSDLEFAGGSTGDQVLVRPTGKFRIYLGAAPGVGKTFAMLDEGRRRAERGTDLVVGYVETYNRPQTEAKLAGLEIVPRKKVEYREQTFEEMDLEAVLARKPEVALVDELAHTNIPGSGRHEKRWQDVLELLEQGVSVITTVNVQHLESVSTAVEAITGVRVHERVPDWVVRRADQLELIDSSPDQLRRRMLHGNIYPQEKVPAALSNFFRIGNLTALRELALRFVADDTEEEMLEYLREQGIAGPWDTCERILVAVTAAEGMSEVVRRAARLAMRLKGDLLAVHVIADDGLARPETDVVEMKGIVDSVGGAWHEMPGTDVATTVMKFAEANQVTQIVIGSSRHSRWRELTGRSLVAKLVRMGNDSAVDVHVIARR